MWRKVAALGILFGIIRTGWSQSVDQCRNDPNVLLLGGATCGVPGNGLSPGFTCDNNPTMAILCPVTCGLCDQYPPPACDADDVYHQKLALIEVLQVLGRCENCTAPLVWTEHHYVVLEPSENFLGITRTWATDVQGDPCGQTGITCNRCGEVVYVAVGFGQAGVEVTSHLPPTFGRLHRLEEILMNGLAVGELPSPTDPAANYLAADMWSNLTNLQAVLITDLITGDVPDFRFHEYLRYVSLTNNRLYGKAETLFGPPYLYFAFSQGISLDSGPMPDSICQAPFMLNMVTTNLNLQGALPSCLNMPLLQVMQLHGSSMSGQIGQLAALPALQELRIDHNSFTGTLPEAMSATSELTSLSFSGNQISGTLPDLSRHTGLTLLDGSNNQLVGAQGLSGTFLVVDLSYNLLEELPQAFMTLPSVTSLNLRGNRLKSWPPAGVRWRGVVWGEAATSFQCPSLPKHPEFHWPQMDKVNLADNDLGGQDVRDVLGSLSGLPRIRIVEANDCNMSMDLPMETLDRMLPRIDFIMCEYSALADGFQNLNTMRLSGNRITGLGGAPWPSLQIMDIRDNDLRHVHPAWFDGSSSVISQDFRGNPDLRLSLDIPSESTGCQGAMILTMNPRSFLAPSADTGYECTSLCIQDGISTSIDSSVNSSVLCRCRPGWHGSGTDCAPCRKGFFCSGGAVGGETQCPTHSDTQSTGAVVETDCECNAGYYRKSTVDGAMMCGLCPANRFRPMPNARNEEECFQCEQGKYSNPGNAGDCLPCENGTVPAGTGGGCSSCTAGSYADASTKACEPCPLGQFQANDRATACSHCIGPRNTTWSDTPAAGVYLKRLGAENDSFCGCDEGYHPYQGSCVKCGSGRSKGLICNGGLSEKAVLVRRGYYASEGWPISVYRCWGEEGRCEGGLPGQTCRAKRYGVACALCMDGYVDDGADRCIECDGSSALRLIVSGIVVLAAAVAFYDLIDQHSRVRLRKSTLVVSSVMSLTVTVLQQLALLSQLSIEWSDPLKSLLDTFRLLNFDLRFIHADCIRNMEPSTSFNLRICIIVGFCVLMTVIHVGFVVLRHGGRFKARRASLVCSLGGVVTLLYISVVVTMVAPFNCRQHPNKKWTMQAYPSVVCWETSEHSGMIVSSCIGFLLPLGYFAHAARTVWTHPKRIRMGDGEFQKAYEFYFIRFAVASYWFILVQIGRNLAIALTVVIPDSAVSIFIALLVIGGYAILVAVFQPWREPVPNWLDLLLTCCVAILFGAAFRFMQDDNRTDRTISLICMIAIIAVISTLPITVFVVLARRVLRRRRFNYFLCHHKASAGAFVRLMKVWLIGRHNSTLFQMEVFLDTDHLDNLDMLFNFVRSETEILVAVWSRDLLVRPWCVGELTIARESGVRVAVVRMPDQEPVTDEFIQHYAENVNLDRIFEYGLDLAMVHTTLRWTGDNPTVAMAEAPSPAVMEGLSSFLSTQLSRKHFHRSGQAHSLTTLEYAPGPVKQDSHCICADESNCEAIASGMVLERLLVEMQMHAFMLPMNCSIPDTARGAMWLCSGGCLQSPPFLMLMSGAASAKLTGLPVVVQESFQFPGRASIRVIGSRSPGDGEAEELADYIFGMFKGIAVEFQAQTASEQALKLGAVTVAQRLMGQQSSRTGWSLTRGLSSLSHNASRRSERSVCSSAASASSSIRKGTSCTLVLDRRHNADAMSDMSPSGSPRPGTNSLETNSTMKIEITSTLQDEVEKASQRSTAVAGDMLSEWDVDDPDDFFRFEC